MPTSITGKGAFLWKLDRCLPVDAIVDQCARANLSHLIIKVADGDSAYAPNAPYLPSLLERLRQRLPNLAVLGYQYLYSGCWFDRASSSYLYNPNWSTPGNEAATIARLFSALALDGIVLDVEGEFEHYNPATRATSYAAALRPLIPAHTPIALSTFRYVDVHPDLPWRTFAALCTHAMPQVYWMGESSDTAGAANLNKSLAQYQRLYTSFNLPLAFVPTGAAFHESGWGATPKQFEIFCERAAALDLSSVNLWEYWFAAVEKPEFWEVYSKFEFASPTPPPTPTPTPTPPPPPLYHILTVNVGVGASANIRSKPWGPIVATVPNLTTLASPASLRASDGSLWWNIGSGYIADSVVK